MSNNAPIIKLDKLREGVFSLSTEEILDSVVRKEDFVIINNKIEPTRELALKLFAVTKIENYTCELQQVVSNEKETVYIVKATVSMHSKKAEGLGACSTLEIDHRAVDKRTGQPKEQTRHHHDALATAETRAYKRALEAVVGAPFINEIILKLFGGYEIKGEKKDTPSISPSEFKEKMKNAKALTHLKNIWNKYSKNLLLYTKEEREELVKLKEEMKRILKERGC
jgi:hypothetical protein